MPRARRKANEGGALHTAESLEPGPRWRLVSHPRAPSGLRRPSASRLSARPGEDRRGQGGKGEAWDRAALLSGGGEDSAGRPVGAARSRNTQTFSAIQVRGAGDRDRSGAVRGVQERRGKVALNAQRRTCAPGLLRARTHPAVELAVRHDPAGRAGAPGAWRGHWVRAERRGRAPRSLPAAISVHGWRSLPGRVPGPPRSFLGCTDPAGADGRSLAPARATFTPWAAAALVRRPGVAGGRGRRRAALPAQVPRR